MNREEALKIVIAYAENMAGYEHHSGFPNYDGGHSEPENECKHMSCLAIRIIKEEKK